MDLQLVYILTRSVERLLIVAIGGASLWMGWQLFLRLQLEAQQGEISYREISVKMQRIAPGIFFAAFGTILLGIAIFNSTTFSSTQGGDVNIRSLSDPNTFKKQIVSLNITQAIGEIPENDLITENLRDGLRQHLSDIINIRERILVEKFGRQRIDLWKQNRDALRNGLQPMPKNEMDQVKEIDDLISSLK